MHGRLRQIIRVLSALPPEREDWLLIEPKKGLAIPIPDFQRAHRGGISYRQKGLPSSKEERRLIGPRLLLFAIIIPVVQLPLWGEWTIVSVSAARWRMLTVGAKVCRPFRRERPRQSSRCVAGLVRKLLHACEARRNLPAICRNLSVLRTYAERGRYSGPPNYKGGKTG